MSRSGRRMSAVSLALLCVVAVGVVPAHAANDQTTRRITVFAS